MLIGSATLLLSFLLLSVVTILFMFLLKSQYYAMILPSIKLDLINMFDVLNMLIIELCSAYHLHTPNESVELVHSSLSQLYLQNKASYVADNVSKNHIEGQCV